jgi:transcriptional regulator with XRE-family HTH domain
MDRKGRRTPPGDADSGRREGLGRAIQALRAERGLKRQDLAKRADLSYAYLAEIENGKKRPSTRVLDAIAGALGVRLPQLMELAESLQSMVEATENEFMPLEMPRAFEKSPLMARRLSPPGQTWFHRATEPTADRMMAGEVEETASAGSTDNRSRESLLEELRARASRLSPQDLERLIDIARRLSS